MSGLLRLVARQPAPLHRAEARLLRRILAGRSLEQLTHSRLAQKAVRFPIPDEFFELHFPSGGSAWFDSSSAPFLYWSGFQTFEPSVVPEFAELVARATTFVDGGAAFGFYVLYARAVNPEVEVTAIEANPRQADVLQKTLKRNGVDVRVVRAAASDVSGVATLSLAGGLSSTESPQWGTADRIEVEAVTIDELFAEPPGLVKIDVEGAELRVLRGMERSLSHRRTTVFCEIKPMNLSAVTALVAGHGYSVRTLAPEDFLLVPS
jgi:FkbM family methyltransferase